VITVRAMADAEILRRCTELQMRIWGMGRAEVVPDHQLIAAVSAGGAVLGAFAPDGALVGFSYAFPGWRRGRPLWYSHMTGVLREYRDAGIGLSLKRTQRECALAAGIDHIVWTFDPLQAGNARFNLGRLGAVAFRYYVDYYGPMTDAINQGLPSDRLEVDWYLRSGRVAARLEAAPRRPIDEDAAWAVAAGDAGTSAFPGPPHLDLGQSRILVEIPPDLHRLKRDHPAAAAAWRAATRAVFQHYFARGYSTTDAAWVRQAQRQRIAYLLERADDEPSVRDRPRGEGATP
jgi:predicted GNAT superfamily acetyltransferase